ncbi:MAG: ribosome biogenesis GTPase Der [bacterium]
MKVEVDSVNPPALSWVVIVGRPNVGKSTLFNRILGKRDAIVDDQPGVTRDVLFRQADWCGKYFTLADTGGVFGPGEDPFSQIIQQQIERAARHAAVILFLVDGQTGPVPLDHDIALFLRRLDKPIVTVVNKVDAPQHEAAVMASFYELGLTDLHAVSALHGTGIGDMLDAVAAYIPDEGILAEPPALPAIAILGRPNTGKSTLLNTLCGSERSIVSPIPGTTRDPVDTEVEVNGKRYLLIDTAGIRRRGKTGQGLEHYTLIRSQQALERCDLALLLIDAQEGLTETDAKVFGLAKDAGKAAIILVNKWDLVEKDERTTGAYAKAIRERIPFLHYAPLEFISALTRLRVQRIFPHVERILEQYHSRAATADLNALLEKLLSRNPPPLHKGRTPRIYYWTQVGTAPPTFVAFANDPKAIHFSYQRFLINQLYETFGLEGTPVRLYFKKRESRKIR